MLLDCNSVISKPHYSKSFSTDSPVGPFVGSDRHIVRVVNRKGNTCRQARVHWLLASLVPTNQSSQKKQPSLPRQYANRVLANVLIECQSIHQLRVSWPNWSTKRLTHIDWGSLLQGAMKNKFAACPWGKLWLQVTCQSLFIFAQNSFFHVPFLLYCERQKQLNVSVHF